MFGEQEGGQAESEREEIEEGIWGLAFAINSPNNAKRFLKRKMLTTKTELAI